MEKGADENVIKVQIIDGVAKDKDIGVERIGQNRSVRVRCNHIELKDIEHEFEPVDIEIHAYSQNVEVGVGFAA